VNKFAQIVQLIFACINDKKPLVWPPELEGPIDDLDAPWQNEQLVLQVFEVAIVVWDVYYAKMRLALRCLAIRSGRWSLVLQYHLDAADKSYEQHDGAHEQAEDRSAAQRFMLLLSE
jgi:hypothetical protein